MPRRRSTATPPAGDTSQPAQTARPERAPSERKVKDLLRLNRTASENMDEIRSSLGGTMADAVENHGLHKKAFGWVKQLDKMSPEKIHDLMQHFGYYYDVSGIRARAESAPRLPATGGPGETEADPPASDTRPTAEVVTPFPRQAAATVQ